MRPRTRSLVLPVLALLIASPAWSVPSREFPRPEQPADDLERPGVTARGAIWAAQDDTTWYGGTVWAADSLRWEAIRGGRWTFDTGIGSSINTGTTPGKPVGYHATMEGWTGLDETRLAGGRFERSSACAISGSWSLRAGVDQAEADSLCYVSGQGYGNLWNLIRRKSFDYQGGGSVNLQLDYAIDAEPSFDYAYVMIDTTGDGSRPPVTLMSRTGIQSGTLTATLTPGSSLRSTPGPVRLILQSNSDGGYSDEDGAYPTACGLAVFDNIDLSGAIADSSDFEAGPDGWELVFPTGVGDFTDLADLGDLPPMVAFCPCGLRDSVLVYFDPTGHHPLDQENLALSPWVDLKRSGDVGRPGRILSYDVYAETPLANYVFVTLKARWYPDLCQTTGRLRLSPFRDQNIVFYFGETPFCNPVNAWRLRDYSGVISSGAEQIQVAVGILDLCRTAPFGTACNGLTNTTPWIDNFALGIYGVATAPNVKTTTLDRFQDNFAADGTMNPGAPGRIDVNRLKNNSKPNPGSILADTLVARGDGGNTEVRLVFRVRPGPFTNSSALATRAALWTTEPALSTRYGGQWYSARMDTAEQGGVTAVSQWMSAFHELDPGFRLTDTAADPTNPSQLLNDVMPDNLFTPGSRIDYFVASRYLPPDPRNPAGLNWYTDPDTSEGRFREVEILPSSMSPDTSWNCTLYVDHHDDRGFDEQRIEEEALTAALGRGRDNFEGTRYDRFDNQTPSSGQLSFGRNYNCSYGCSSLQVYFYKDIAWHSADLASGQLTNEDAGILNPWLRQVAYGPRRFWGSGTGLATSMHGAGTGGQARIFLNDVLGVLRTCDTIRSANCPAGAAVDSSYCLPLVAAATPHFVSTILPRVRGNGCPDLRSFDLLGANSAVSTARGQLDYWKGGQSVSFAAVSRWNTIDVDYRAVLDGMPLGQLRTNNGSVFAGCDDYSAALARCSDVLSWFGPPTLCAPPPPVAVEMPPRPGALPGFHLGRAAPNPTHGPAVIFFESRSLADRIMIRLFDVTGRPVRTLVEGSFAAGPHEVAWDGRADDGRAVASGLYWYRMEAGDYRAAGKLIVQR